MPTLVTTVYLNHGPDNFFGLNPCARLRQAARFDLTLAEHLRGEHLAHAALELIFEQLNIDVPEHPWAIQHRQAGHRSLSVGDVCKKARYGSVRPADQDKRSGTSRPVSPRPSPLLASESHAHGSRTPPRAPRRTEAGRYRDIQLTAILDGGK